MSATISRGSRRPGFRHVADRFELTRHVEIARTWPQTSSQLVCDQLASWSPASELLARTIAPHRPNSIMLSSSLADRRPAREPAGELVRELDSVMECGFNRSM